MPLTAFLLVASAALAHATWNLLVKHAAHSRRLIWFSSTTEAALLLPVALWVTANSWSRLGVKAALFLVATGVVHLLYTAGLQRGYQAGDFSVVYPLARGSGPLLSFCGAILVLGEHLSVLAGAGALLITGGILLISARATGSYRGGLFWGIATGFAIASYTLIDGYSVKVLLLAPVLVEYAGNLVRAIMLSVGTLRDRASLAIEYREFWKEATAIAILTPAAYILVLFAMQIAPVSRVAPVREMSMMIGAWFGVKFLREENAGRRIFGSALIVAGVAALAWS
ncbi:MAG: EamA family transporter [Bryobacteraceae bacterium]